MKGKPIFTRPAEVWHHLRRLQQYSATRSARQQQARVTRQQHKRRRAQGAQPNASEEPQPRKERCQGKGGAKRSAGAYASNFYAGPLMPPGVGRGPQYWVADVEDATTGAVRSRGAALFTPPPKCTAARRPEPQPRLPCLWICAAHLLRQCASCAAVCQGARRASPAVRGCAGSAWWGTSNGSAYPGGRGHTISKAAQTPASSATGLHTGTAPQAREGERDPPPPQPRGCADRRRALPGMEEQGRR